MLSGMQALAGHQTRAEAQQRWGACAPCSREQVAQLVAAESAGDCLGHLPPFQRVPYHICAVAYPDCV